MTIYRNLWTLEWGKIDNFLFIYDQFCLFLVLFCPLIQFWQIILSESRKSILKEIGFEKLLDSIKIGFEKQGEKDLICKTNTGFEWVIVEQNSICNKLVGHQFEFHH